MAAKGTAWSIKGIDEATRTIARGGAKSDNITIGTWIDQAIRFHAPGGAGVGGLAAAAEATSGAALPAVISSSPSATPSRATSPRPTSSADGELLLEHLDTSLGQSQARIDAALRPVGLQLYEVAQKLIAAEREVPPHHDTAPLSLGADDLLREPDLVREPYRAPEMPTPTPPTEDFARAVSPVDMPFPPDFAPNPTPDHEPDPTPARFEEFHDLSLTVSVPQPDPSPDLALDPQPEPEPVTERLARLTADLQRRADAADAVEADQSPTGSQAGRRTAVPEWVSDPGPSPQIARGTGVVSWIRWIMGVALLLILLTGVGAFVMADQLGMGARKAEVMARLPHQVEAIRRTVLDAVDNLRHVILGEPKKSPDAPEHGSAKMSPDSQQTTAQQPTSQQPAADQPMAKTEAPPVTPALEAPAQAAVPADSTHAKAPSATTPAASPSHAKVPPTKVAANATGPTKSAAKSAPKSKVRKTPAQTANLPPARISKKTTHKAPKPSKPTPAAPLAAGKPRARLSGPEYRVWLEAKAARGDGRAQHDLGVIHARTEPGAAPDFEAAARWFREAAIQGIANAQYNLGVLYERGQGVETDNVRALLWYHSAAEQNHALAQYNLGVFYAEGRGVPANAAEALIWFKAAATRGVAKAYFNWAVMTEDGLGVPADADAARPLFAKAAELGDTDAIERMRGYGVTVKSADTAPARPSQVPLAGTVGTDTKPSGGGAQATLVASIQEQLLGLGLYAGRVDGISGPVTRGAVREYERQNGLTVHGIPSRQLLDHMRQQNR